MRLPTIIIGVLMLAAGAVLAGPYLIGHLRYRTVQGSLRAVYGDPVDEGQVRLVYLFDFPVDGDRWGYDGSEVFARGVGRCDPLGRPLPDPVMNDAAGSVVLEDLRNRINDRCLVYYDPAAPLETARFCDVEGSTWRFDAGLLLMFTPLLVWLGMGISTWSQHRGRGRGDEHRTGRAGARSSRMVADGRGAV